MNQSSLALHTKYVGIGAAANVAPVACDPVQKFIQLGERRWNEKENKRLLVDMK